MASSLKVLSLVMIFSSLYILSRAAYEYKVGDEDGWKVPPSNDTTYYNDWASKKGFIVGDTIRFKYTHRKDSVLEVGELDYKNCNCSTPNWFSSSGNTVFKLDRSGPFYFISGASSHCQRGQRMIIWVGADSKSNGYKLSAYSFTFELSCVVFAHFVLSYLF